VGDRAEIFLELGARVVCVEPQEECLGVLRRRFAGNPDITIVEKALGESEGVAELSVCEYNSGLSTLSNVWAEQSSYADQYEWTRKVQVPLTTLDALIDLHGVPAFCKVDVEGYEAAVLKGLNQPVACLSLEFHRELPDLARSCLDRVQEIGTATCNFTLNDAVQMSCSDWVSPDELFGEIEDLDDTTTWGDIYIRFDEAAGKR